MDQSKEWRKKYGPEFQKKIEFYRQVAAPAVVAGERLGMDPRLLMAQAALESGWAKSELAKQAKNLGGVKAFRNEPYVEMDSPEGYGASRKIEKSRFIKYPSINAFFEDWPQKFRDPRYKTAIKQTDPEAYARALGKAGYYTENPDKYAALMKSLYRDIDRMMLDPSIIDSRIAEQGGTR